MLMAKEAGIFNQGMVCIYRGYLSMSGRMIVMKRKIFVLALASFWGGIAMAQSATNEALELQLNKLSAQVNYLSDREQIRNLADSFTLPFDAFDLASYKANYTADGIFELDLDGKVVQSLALDKMDDFFLPRYRKFKAQGGQRRHLITNVYIANQSAESATVYTNALLMTTLKHQNLSMVTTIKYTLQMKKVAGVWKLQHVTGDLDRSLD